MNERLAHVEHTNMSKHRTTNIAIHAHGPHTKQAGSIRQTGINFVFTLDLLSELFNVS